MAMDVLSVDDSLVIEVYKDGNAELFLRDPDGGDAVVIHPDVIPRLQGALAEARAVLSVGGKGFDNGLFVSALANLSRDELVNLLLHLRRHAPVDQFMLEFATIYRNLDKESQRLLREKVDEIAASN
jgi:hypothetical protein